MVRKFKLTENKYSKFNSNDFYKYLYDISEQAVERFENDYPVQRISTEFPTYDYDWAADFIDDDINGARNKAIKALADYQLLSHLYYYNK